MTEKGQITIPKHLRKKYAIGDKVLFVESSEGILVKRVPKISELAGSLNDYKVDIARIRQEGRRLEEARERWLMAVLKRSKKRRHNIRNAKTR